MTVRPWWQTAACVAAAGMTLAACGGNGDSAADSGVADGEYEPSGTISLLAQKHPWTAAIEPYIPEFEEETGITVEVQTFAEEQARDRHLTQLQSGSTDFDVFMSLKSREGQMYADAGFYEPLDPWLEDTEATPDDWDRDDFKQAPWEGEAFNGEQLGLPIIVEGPVVFYRKDLFEEHGIERPKSQDELIDAAAAIEDATQDSVTGVTIRGLAPALPYTFGPFFHGTGLEWLDDDGAPNFDEPEAVEAIERYVALARDHGPEGVLNYSFTQSSQLFAQGHAGMSVESSNEISSVIDPEDSTVAEDVGVMPTPPGPGGQHPTVLQWGISMSPYSENQDAAWEFMKWATSPEMQLQLAMDGIASPRASTWESEEFQETLDRPALTEWAEALDVIQTDGHPEVAPPGENQPEIRQIIGDGVGQVIAGNMDAAEAAQQIQSELETVLG
ncbi:sugar ABC transporter substrate-binding protein [Actinobacteria bacterium YIM 96077]|uniref:Sugar ABC transporter substrate-binding protein n=1 Tax=Phytoactinopolyspora halophila TaxID=1981511 RepID=A0A329R1M5_9ACTN|nr:sugar ABC transporter substrate-binding protein [Phytoactinopolyspora halophila]AYY11708.1 sugar ABC transporter substrate-binding protein [Actinobacteria bacterium YIM 96077]RAW17859.1 hypothetical protein DPM12_03125 [Phytoactinopolyspora halophila]